MSGPSVRANAEPVRDLTDQVDLAVRAHARPGPRFPEVVWAGGDVRLRLWAEQAADVARVLGIGVDLPLGMELAGVGVRTSAAAEVDGVAMVQMSEQYARRFAAMLEAADRRGVRGRDGRSDALRLT